MAKNVLCNLTKNQSSVLPMYPRKPGVLLQKVSLALCSFHKSKAMQMRFTPNKKIRVPLPKDGIHGRAELSLIHI